MSAETEWSTALSSAVETADSGCGSVLREPAGAESMTEGARAEWVATYAHEAAVAIKAFLENMATSFPDNTGLIVFKNIFLSTMWEVPDREHWLATEWHVQMTTYPDGTPRVPDLYAACDARDAKTLFAARLYVLQSINAWDIYNSDDFGDDERETVFQYIERINTEVQMMHSFPGHLGGLFDIAARVAARRGDQTATPDTAFAMTQEMFAAVSADASTSGKDPACAILDMMGPTMELLKDPRKLRSLFRRMPKGMTAAMGLDADHLQTEIEKMQALQATTGTDVDETQAIGSLVSACNPAFTKMLASMTTTLLGRGTGGGGSS